MSGTAVWEPSSSPLRRCRKSIRRDPLPINPVLLAAAGTETVSVHKVDYVAQPAGYDAEECIQKALEDDEIEMYCPSRGSRGYDIYRLTAKGRRISDMHLREMLRKSAEDARREYEESAAAGQAASGEACKAGRMP